MAKSKIVLVDQSKFIDFRQKGLLVTKKDDSGKTMIVVMCVGAASEELFHGIIMFTSLNSTDLFRQMEFKTKDFEIFKDILNLQN